LSFQLAIYQHVALDGDLEQKYQEAMGKVYFGGVREPKGTQAVLGSDMATLGRSRPTESLNQQQLSGGNHEAAPQTDGSTLGP